LSVLLVTASLVLLSQAEFVFASLAAVGAGIAWGFARPALRRLEGRQQLGVWCWSFVALAALVAMTLVAAAAVGVSESFGALAALGLMLLAGMAVPLNIGGWGPREAAAAFAATVVGAHAAEGVSVAVGYGLLATVSVLPGFFALVAPRLFGARLGPRQVKLHTDVVVKEKTS